MIFMARKRRKTSNLQLVLVVLVVFLAGVLTALQFMEPKEIIQPIQVIKNLTVPPQISEGSRVEMLVPAVDTDGNGVTTRLMVEAKPGTGKVLTNIDILLFWVDTQQSIQVARDVAKNITGIDTDALDITYAIEADNVSLVGGPSAGAALTVATIAALQAKQPDPNAAITGTINPDGTIGKVGSVYEKARAVKRDNVMTLLVPTGEGVEITVRPIEKCIEEPEFTFCETYYKQKKVNIGEALGMEVIEVGNVSEALPYFFE
ncbi:MAG: S16 family serine protease [Candidatus Aenigmatarchaeota archaeon]